MPARLWSEPQWRGGESLLDMGCGAGSLAIPYGLRGNHVLACDFSPRMLDVLGEGIRVHHLETIVTPQAPRLG